MKAHQIMTRAPVCCVPDTPVSVVARMMEDVDCGCIPVVDDIEQRHLVGIVTDRDLALRVVAHRNDVSALASDVMTQPVFGCSPDVEIEDVEALMAEHQVRRVPVVDEDNVVLGIIAQADIARSGRAASEDEVGRLVEKISEPASERFVFAGG